MKSIIFFVVLFSSVTAFGQMETIRIKNPSFEAKPKVGEALSVFFYSRKSKNRRVRNKMLEVKGWVDSGWQEFPAESIPDIHPSSSGNRAFGVDLKAEHGNTYLGMVTRPNNSWEYVSQKLKSRFQIGACYSLSMYVARSEKYNSYIRVAEDSNEMLVVDFTNPIIVRIWGGSCEDAKEELLAQSEPISNVDWKRIDFQLFPLLDYKYITIEAYYRNGFDQPYAGHVMIDNLSDITEISCTNQ